MLAEDKYKVLCLHGIGSNSDIFEAQTASLRYCLGESYEFSFVDGGHLWPAAAGIEASYGKEQSFSCFSYYDGTAASAAEAVRDLASYLCENGPFHYVLGFSLGASLIATLLLGENTDESIRKAKDMVKSAVFICGIPPQNWEQLRSGHLEETNPEDLAEDMKIDTHTIHAFCLEDDQFPGRSQLLLKLCQNGASVKILHTAGHDVPRKSDEVEALAKAMASHSETFGE
ncbi:FSH1 domain containing protein [Diaporthe eres]|uniref:Serine hydrolase domain-containing protein n=1 Tax=Diaporthe vaccinii TaxID=105482 RepID=A0ABR4EL90_9PEZI|nr:FSH1 domain containing protein [Diaporthe eres]